MPFYEKDAKGELVPIGEVPEEVISAIERYDEEAIAHRLTTGIASDAFIYHYPIKTGTGVKEVIGVSTDGADEIAHQLGNIEVLPDIKVDKDSDPDYFYVIVRAKDLIRNVTLLGTGRASKYQLGKGNQPDHDRPNEWAFVSSVSKAQRNAILRHTPEEVIVKIINFWLQRGKSKQLRPPPLDIEETPPRPLVVTTPPTPATTTTAAQVTDQQERLKKLRMEVHNKFQTDLGIGVEKRKEILSKKFGVNSLTDLNEQQLKECKVLVEEMIEQGTKAPPVVKPPTDAELKANRAKELGFENVDEQNKLRGTLYTMLTNPNQLGLKDEEAKKFVTERNFDSTSNIPKTRLIEMIKEVDEIVKIKQTPSSPPEPEPEDIPF